VPAAVSEKPPYLCQYSFRIAASSEP